MTSSTFHGQCLRWHHQPHGLEVELARPPCNEIGLTFLSELELLVAHVTAGAEGARALIFHSTLPRGFCAGADLRELYRELVEHRATQPAPERRVEVRGFLDRIHHAFSTLDAAPLTTIAAVHGVVFGGGFELALTCDVVVADKSARFCFPELRLGLIPGFGGVPRLRRDLGNALVRDILLTGRSLGAPRAYEIGLVAHLVGRGEALRAARSLAAQATKFDAPTARAAKAFLKPIPHDELEREKQIFCDLFMSPVVEKALADFVTRGDALPYLP